MLLLTGPAGSGKSRRVAERFRDFLRRNDSGVRLLVPTATMARHLQNRFAREGFVFRPALVQTLSRFTDTLAEDLPQVSEAAFYLIVEEAARRAARPEFEAVVQMPGFCASLARAMAEFSSAGCTAPRLAANLPETPLGPAFLAIYQEVERELERRGLATRARRLEHAAARIARDGMPGISTVLLDGFHALPDPDLAVISAMGRRVDLVLTLPDDPTTAALSRRLLDGGFTEERCTYARPAVPAEIVAAPTLEREADEIARRIVEAAAAGRPFRDIAIIVRTPDVYEPILRATLERYGVPARFLFDADLARHPAAQYLAGAVDAMLSGWDFAATLAVLRCAPEAGRSAAMDRIDFAVRERLPGAGLAGLREIAGTERTILRLLDSLAALDTLRDLTLPAPEWARRVPQLLSCETPARSYPPALEAFHEALAATGEALAPGGAPIPFAEYWRAFKAVLRLTPLRLADDRRNVVSVLGAHEARQWQVPMVFVCGMVEKQFPSLHRQDPFFPDTARRDLARAGIRVRTAAEFEAEERALFDSAVSRATALTVLSYPRANSKGDQNLPSLFLDGLDAPRRAPAPVRPAPLAARPDWHPAVAVRDPELLEWIAARTTVLSPTALESFLHCPYSFYGRHVLRLQEPPPAPEDRLDFLVQGNIVHAVLAAWPGPPQPIEPLFDRLFAEACAGHHIVSCYRTEWLRHRMLEDVRAFAASDAGPRGIETRTEQPFEYVLADGLSIRGRIDRLEVLDGNRAFVIDYKYSTHAGTKKRVEDPGSLQPPLYVLAVERSFDLEPAGMQYCALREGPHYEGWEAPFPPEWIPAAIERSLDAAARMRAGEIAPHPADGEACRWCENRDVCRYRAVRAVAAEAR